MAERSRKGSPGAGCGSWHRSWVLGRSGFEHLNAQQSSPTFWPSRRFPFTGGTALCIGARGWWSANERGVQAAVFPSSAP